MRSTKQLKSLFSFHSLSAWPATLRQVIEKDVRVKENFITLEEEIHMFKEVEPHMKRLRYEKSHWDDAIHLYREREQRTWSPISQQIICRIRDYAFPMQANHLTHVHILDLHKDGVIKPHIDSIRYCGDVISGVSLLSDCVMRLRHKDQKDVLIVDLLLRRRSLYRIAGVGRYDFTHEVLSAEESTFEGQKVIRDRRISIICRDIAKSENMGPI